MVLTHQKNFIDGWGKAGEEKRSPARARAKQVEKHIPLRKKMAYWDEKISSRHLRPSPKKDVAKILRRIEALRAEPRPPGVEKLSGQEKYRIRQGVYRILYEIQNNELIIVVVKVGHRRDVYRIS